MSDRPSSLFPIRLPEARLRGGNHGTSTAELETAADRAARVDGLEPPDAFVPSPEPAADGDLHVEPVDALWRIRVQGSGNVIATVRTQSDALDRARDLALAHDLRVVLHRRDGKVSKAWQPRA